MNKQEYMIFARAFVDKMMVICAAKNSDYTGAGDDPFKNFRHVESFGLCSSEVGIMTRMTDKMARVASFMEKGELKVKDESVKDTLIDLANYSMLLAAVIEEKTPVPNS